jgi:non-structural maintenance of chromosomes element 4
VQKLSKKCTNRSSSSEYFDWKFLGVEAGICFNALPERVTFFAGALDQEVTVKVRAARQPRVKEATSEEAEVKPEAVENKNNKGNADDLSAMEKAMRAIRKKLTARSMEEINTNPGTNELSDQHPDIDGIQFLFNPTSFTQTVENIFNFSFLIKKGEAEIGVRPPLRRRSPTGAYVAYRTFNPDEQTAECTQAVCVFTMADWRRLCAKQAAASPEQHFVGDLPHRKGTRHGRNSDVAQN